MDERTNTKQITMAQQTAVNYLVKILSEVIDEDYYKKEIERAKKMEKEQIRNAIIWGDRY